MYVLSVTGHAGAGKDTVADVFVEAGFLKIALADPMKRFLGDTFLFTDKQLWGASKFRNTADKVFKKEDAWTDCWGRLQVTGRPWIHTLLPNARPLEVEKAFHALEDWFHTLRAAHPNPSPRACLQTLGTEWGQAKLYPNVWINYMYRTAMTLTSGDYGYSHRFGLVDYPPHPQIRGIIVPDVRFSTEFQFFKDTPGCKMFRIIRPIVAKTAPNVGVFEHRSEIEQKSFADSSFDVIIQNTGSLTNLLDTVQVLVATYTDYN